MDGLGVPLDVRAGLLKGALFENRAVMIRHLGG